MSDDEAFFGPIDGEEAADWFDQSRYDGNLTTLDNLIEKGENFRSYHYLFDFANQSTEQDDIDKWIRVMIRVQIEVESFVNRARDIAMRIREETIDEGWSPFVVNDKIEKLNNVLFGLRRLIEKLAYWPDVH